jgi:hypothetical protein
MESHQLLLIYQNKNGDNSLYGMRIIVLLKNQYFDWSKLFASRMSDTVSEAVW